MVGISSLTRPLPETSEDMYELFTIEDDKAGVLDVFSESPSMDFADKGSKYYGIISQIVCRVWTTSVIEGLEFVSSWQHFMAKLTNFATHSEGYEPILLSITDNIMPDR
ncbi:hypothetical protein SLA2020_461550 [Shorea laevis]